jgi:hypothetical protein
MTYPGHAAAAEDTICPADTATNPNLSWPALRRPRLPAVALSAGHIVYIWFNCIIG